MSLVKKRLNLADTDVTQDQKIQEFISEADSFTNTQLAIFTTVPIINPEQELISLNTSLAAALTQFWTSQTKSPDLKAIIDYYETRLAAYIQSIYGKRARDGLGTGLWSKAKSQVTGTE